MHIGLWSTNQLLKDDVQYKYNIAAASIARAIGTILWVLLLVIPLVQVRVYMCIIKGLGRYATGINYIILSSIIYIYFMGLSCWHSTEQVQATYNLIGWEMYGELYKRV